MSNENYIQVQAAKILEIKAQIEDLKRQQWEEESKLAAAFGVPEQWTGQKTNTVGLYKITARRALNTKIDVKQLRKIATDHALENKLGELFRWKPEIDRKAWDKESLETRTLLSYAITQTPGKISFAVERQEA